MIVFSGLLTLCICYIVMRTLMVGWMLVMMTVVASVDVRPIFAGTL